MVHVTQGTQDFSWTTIVVNLLKMPPYSVIDRLTVESFAWHRIVFLILAFYNNALSWEPFKSHFWLTWSWTRRLTFGTRTVTDRKYFGRLGWWLKQLSSHGCQSDTIKKRWCSVNLTDSVFTMARWCGLFVQVLTFSRALPETAYSCSLHVNVTEKKQRGKFKMPKLGQSVD